MRILDASRRRFGLLAAAAFLTLPASGMSLFGGGEVPRPAESEFGLGPRPSANRIYLVTLQPRESLRPRVLMTMPVAITDAAGRPVQGAKLAIDGGMPEHHHGLPTQPRPGREIAPGLYEIDGLRFNMRGWWELKLAIESAAGADMITFNLQL